MTQGGRYLAELTRAYHGLRPAYLKWAERAWAAAPEVALGHFRRALIGWYEAKVRPAQPYSGETDEYVKAAATAYFSGQPEVPTATLATLPPSQQPQRYLPRPVRLDETQQTMLRLFGELGKNCRELLLMADYHHLAPTRIADILEIPEQLPEVAARREKCHLMLREQWQLHGLADPDEALTLADERRIDQYFSGQLSEEERWAVEARRTTEGAFRRAMERAEDWAEVLVVVGRQDLMEALLQEEEQYQRTRPESRKKEDVKLSPRRRVSWPTWSFPRLETIIAVVLLGVAGWLGWTTFGAAAPDRQAVAYFEPYPNIFAQFEPRTEAERDLERILYYYDRKDYLTAYDELLPVAPAYAAAPLYLAVCALALEQPRRALDWLAQISPDSYYHAPAQWYEALAYLADGRRDAAETLLLDIRDDGEHPFRAQAVALLGNL